MITAERLEQLQAVRPVHCPDMRCEVCGGELMLADVIGILNPARYQRNLDPEWDRPVSDEDRICWDEFACPVHDEQAVYCDWTEAEWDELRAAMAEPQTRIINPDGTSSPVPA